jgi:large subunit ribosomal protein L24
MSLRIKKDDKVKVIAGKDKGTVSKVLAVLPDENRAIVENVNMVKKHTRARSQQQQGGILEREASIHLSNLMIYCDSCKKGVRFGVDTKNNEKIRVCKKCGGKL